jgi:hypothetical protein
VFEWIWRLISPYLFDCFWIRIDSLGCSFLRGFDCLAFTMGGWDGRMDGWMGKEPRWMGRWITTLHFTTRIRSE